MHIVADRSPADWLRRVSAQLERAEAENNLLLGLAMQAMEEPKRLASDLTLLSVIGADGVVGAAMRNRYNLVLTRLPDEALALLAEHLAACGVRFPGVIGPDDMAARFLRQWCTHVGGRAGLRQRQRIYECRRVAPVEESTGVFRTAAERDIPMLAEWWTAFHVEVGAAQMNDDPVAAVRRMVQRDDVGVWEAAGCAVSCAATVRRTPHGVVVAFVYTPPDRRGRGYATSCVAQLTRANLAAGAEFCCLYTDLSNPTSNAIYARIGYRRVCDSAWWGFETD